MYNRNNEKPEVGLFTEIIGSSQKLTTNLEQKILSYLEINDLINLVMLNKTLNRKITEEIKRLKQCVTIYTWFGGDSSCESYWDNGTGTRGRMGHSALRTYGNSEGEKGIYVSFYPGDCHNSRRIAGCRKSVSHFHTWNQEMSKEIKESAQAIDLYGLDVDAIHQAFNELHDGQLNSIKGWSTRYNCSDLTLYLLKKGKILEKVDYSPFDFKTIASSSIILSTLFRALMEAFYRIQNIKNLVTSKEWVNTHVMDILNPHVQNKMILRNLMEKALSKDLVTILLHPIMRRTISWFGGYYESVPRLFQEFFSITRMVMSGAINIPLTCLTIYTISNLILTQKYHASSIRKIAGYNTLKSMVFVGVEPLVSYLMGFLLGCLGIDARGYNFFLFNLIGFDSLQKLISLTGLDLHFSYVIKSLNLATINKEYIRVTPKDQLSENTPFISVDYKTPIFKDFTIASILVSYPAVLIGLLVLNAKYFYSTTSTPQHVHNLAQHAANQLNPIKNKHSVTEVSFFKNISQSVYKNRYNIGLGSLFTVGGFFACKAISNNSTAPIDGLNLS